MIGTPISAVALHRAAALQQAHVATDSVLVESPLPRGVSHVVRFLLNTVPPWVQIGGVVVAVAVAAFVLWILLRRRRAIRGWLASRTRAVQWSLAATALVLATVVVGTAGASWDYTQHSNDFCTGCHVMNPAFQRFGNDANKHRELTCHACHQQSLLASARQLYIWVAERPEKIGEHAKVPNRVCEGCHVTRDTATWQRVAATAGHRVHFESDSGALKRLQCVTCHGVEVHRFRPVSETCGQSNCHKPSETGIVLGKMAAQTVRHCTSCHAFTAAVPALATRDSARGTLVPTKQECLGCHEMRRVLADFDEARDPHGGACGMCHNPHVQKTVADARASCTTAGCHANWRNEPFHVGASHRSVGARCLTCHAPHRAKADASDCVGCHTSVRARGTLRPPLPFDTTKALRRATAARELPHATSPGGGHGLTIGAAPDETPVLASSEMMVGEGDVALLGADDSGASRSLPPPAVRDTFPHARHAAKLACLTCHQTGAGHGRLTFEPPRGCAICHHQAPAAARCASCHQSEKYAVPKHETVTIAVPGHPPKPRTVAFLHARHASKACVDCHTTPVTLAPSSATVRCTECHSDHHAAGRDCSACHTMADPKTAHATLEVAHQRCDACHTPTTIARLTPTRSFCGACHAAKVKDHYDARECTVCHFLAEPGVYRSRLATRPAG